MINEVEVGHDVIGSDSEVLNVAIIAQCDEAWSPDFVRFELAFNRFRSSFLDRFGQKIHQEIWLDEKWKIRSTTNQVRGCENSVFSFQFSVFSFQFSVFSFQFSVFGFRISSPPIRVIRLIRGSQSSHFLNRV